MAGIFVAPPILIDSLGAAPDRTGLIVEAIPDAIAIVDRAGVIADVNRHMVALTGQSRADLLGAQLCGFFVEEDLTESCVREAFAHGSVAGYELTLHPHGGPSPVVSCDASTLQNGSAEPD
jgi:PAS domain-containing protein